MSVSQNIDPRVCSAWIYARLCESTVLVNAFSGRTRKRFFQDVRVPTSAQWKNQGDLFPLIYWSGGKTSHAPFYDKERETIGRITSRYVVRVQHEFSGEADWDFFVPFYKELRKVLTGVPSQSVILDGQKIGDVWGSKWVDDFQETHKVQEARILESGILIEISHL